MLRPAVTVLEVRDDQGELVRYVTAREAPAYLGADVSEAMVNKWHSRRMVTGYRVGREVLFRLDELKEVEGVTRRSGKSYRNRGSA